MMVGFSKIDITAMEKPSNLKCAEYIKEVREKRYERRLKKKDNLLRKEEIQCKLRLQISDEEKLIKYRRQLTTERLTCSCAGCEMERRWRHSINTFDANICVKCRLMSATSPLCYICKLNEEELTPIEAKLQVFGELADLAGKVYTGYRADRFIKGTEKKISYLIDAISGAVDMVAHKFNSMLDVSFNMVTFLKRVIYAFANYLMAKDCHKQTSLITNIMNVITEYIPNCVNLLFSFFKFDDKPRLQLDVVDVMQWLKPIAGVVFLILTYFLGKQLPGKTDIESMWNRLGAIGRNLRGISNLVEFFQSTFSVICDSVISYINGVPVKSEADRIIQDYDKWCLDVQDIIVRVDGNKNADKIFTDPNFVIQIENLYKRQMEISRQISDMKLPIKMTVSFHEHSKYLTQIHRAIDTTGAFGNKPRTVPPVIWLYGESQIGKSYVTWPLAIEINNLFVKDVEEAKEFSKNIYFRNVEQEYWDGYNGQNICCYDDFAQIKDTENVPNPEFMELIRTGNIAPFPLHMAHLEDKRKTKFTSKVLLLSSNNPELKVNSLTHPDAVLNRITCMYKVTLKHEYAENYTDKQGNIKTRLAVDKARDAVGGAPFNPDVYRFDRMDPFNLKGEPIRSELSFYDVVQESKDRVMKFYNRSLDLNSFLQDYAVKHFKPNKVETVVDVINDISTKIENKVMDFTETKSEPMDFGRKKLQIDANDMLASIRQVNSDGSLNLTQTILEKESQWYDIILNKIVNNNPVTYVKHGVQYVFEYDYGFPLDISFLKSQINLLDFDYFIFDNTYSKLRNLYNTAKECIISWFSKIYDFVVDHPFLILGGLVTTCISLYLLWRGSSEEEDDIRVVKMTRGVIRIPKPIDGVPIVPVLENDEDLIRRTLNSFKNEVFIQFVSNHKVVPSNLVNKIETQLGSMLVANGFAPIVFIVWKRGEVTTLLENQAMLLTVSDFVYKEMETRDINNPETIDFFKTLKKQPCRYVYRLEQDGYVSILKSKSTNVLEVSVSGDVITRTSKPRILEVATSGDDQTKQNKQRVLEVAYSGDVNTQINKPRVLEVATSGDVVTQKNNQRILELDASLQFWVDKTAQDLIGNKIFKNQYIMSMYAEDRETCIGSLNVLFIRGQVCITVRHVNAWLSRAKYVTLINSFGITYELIPTSDIFIYSLEDAIGREKEAVALVFPKFVHCHSDLVEHFVTKVEMESYKCIDAYVPVMRYLNTDRKRVIPVILSAKDLECRDEALAIEDDEINCNAVIRESVEYTAPTKSGDCGSVIVLECTKLPRKLFAIHAAADASGRAYGEHISRQDLYRLINKIPKTLQLVLNEESFPNFNIPKFEFQDSEIVNVPVKYGDELPCLNFSPFGKCTKPPRVSNRTELHPSLLHGKLLEPITKPAFLSDVVVDGKKIEVMNLNLKKAAMNTPYIEKRLVDEAILDTRKTLFKGMKKDTSILSIEKAVEGIEGDHTRGAITRSTSPGYPWILQKPGGTLGKQFWLGSDENFHIADDVRERVETRIELAKQGIRAPTVWTDTLKDERRPIEKVNAFKTRVFANGPMDFTIAFRMYFLNFISHIMNNKIRNEQSLGTNVFGPDWELTAKMISRKGKAVIAGDFQSFDGTLNSCIVSRFVDEVNLWYDDGEENALIRQVLFSEVFNSIHLQPVMSIYYMWTHSQPSGNPITTVLNSWYNSVSMRVVFQILSRELDERVEISKFTEKVSMVSYGDDNIVNIHESILSWFNQETITRGYKMIGMIYTDEQKTGVVVPYRQIHEIQYLKRNFIHNQKLQRWLAPLEIKSLMEIPNWVRGIDRKTSTKENAQVCIEELSLHDPDTFETHANLIQSAYQKITGEYLDRKSYDCYHEIRFYNFFV